MALRAYLYGLFFLSLAFLVTVLIIILGVNPFHTDSVNLILFFVALFFMLTSFFTLLLFYVKVKFFKNTTLRAGLKTAFLQGFIISLLLSGILVFAALNILNLWTISLYFVILILIELILRVK